MPRNVPPDIIAAFDQTLADVSHHLDIFIATYEEAITEFSEAEAIVALSQALDKRAENKAAACQYLAVAIYRIAEMRATIETVIDDLNNP